MKSHLPLFAMALFLTSGGAVAGTKVSNDITRCAGGKGPAVLVSIEGIKEATGKIRVQTYRATKDEWLSKGEWINRIETPASGENMVICMPMPAAGEYGIAIRHDRNDNGKTDFSKDGGGFSNNPSLNIFNLGKPSYRKVGVPVGDGVTKISIKMKYL